MRATHKDYLQPGFLRVEDRKKVLCAGPDTQLFRDCYRPGLPVWPDARSDQRKSMAA
jgi:hypothetical protein